jgi:hypothetical protein
MVKRAPFGFALPLVLGVLALASLTCATAWQLQWLNQQLLTVQSRLLRHQHIAEGVFPMVVEDITGVITATDTASSLRNRAGDDSQTHAFFPNTIQERNQLQMRMGGALCRSGICAPKTLVNWNAQQWHNLKDIAQPVSAGALPNSEISAFYWVEVWLNAQQPSPPEHAPASPFIYRITVLVQATSPGVASLASQAFMPQRHKLVMQAIWSPADSMSSRGQWHSWKLLA